MNARVTGLAIIAVYWVMLIIGMASCLAIKSDPAVAAIWTGTVAGTALGHALALGRVRIWFALLAVLTLAVIVMPLVMPHELGDSAKLMLAFVPASMCAYWSLGERTTLVAFWFPAVIWMLSIVDHTSAKGMPDATGILLLGALALMFIVFLRVRESRRVALWSTVAAMPLVQPRPRIVLRERPGSQLGRAAWALLASAIAFGATAWVAPRLWQSEGLRGERARVASREGGVGVGVPCCPAVAEAKTHRRRVKEYFNIGRGHDAGAEEEQTKIACDCPQPVVADVAPHESHSWDAPSGVDVDPWAVDGTTVDGTIDTRPDISGDYADGTYRVQRGRGYVVQGQATVAGGGSVGTPSYAPGSPSTSTDYAPGSPSTSTDHVPRSGEPSSYEHVGRQHVDRHDVDRSHRHHVDSPSSPRDVDSPDENVDSSRSSHVDRPRPSRADTPRPSHADTPRPSRADTPRPSRADTPRPSRADTPRPSRADTPEQPAIVDPPPQPVAPPPEPVAPPPQPVAPPPPATPPPNDRPSTANAPQPPAQPAAATAPQASPTAAPRVDSPVASPSAEPEPAAPMQAPPMLSASLLQWAALLVAAALFFQLATLVLRPLRRLVTLRHLRSPFWDETVAQRVSNAWQLALVGLRDAGWRSSSDETPREYARRVGNTNVERCATILERARHGIGIDHDDLATMTSSAQSAYREARRGLGFFGRAISWLRWPLT